MDRFWKSQMLVAGMALLLAFGGCATQQAKFQPTRDQARLVELMEQRLELAKRVAWLKYQSSLPVKDAKREAELLASLEAKGQKLGLSKEQVDRFFVRQLEASREVQAHLIYKWSRGATLPTYAPVDLKKHIRPKLNAISEEMLVKLKAIGPRNPGLQVYAWNVLRKDGYSWRVTGVAVYPLR